MKKIILSAMFSMVAWMGANAMSFSRAQAEALYLTDKMAYELNLNDQQYNDAYEINLDYFLRIDSPSDLYGSYYDYRVHDLRCILHDWQYSLFMAADYFLRPLVWRANSWYFPIYSYYSRDYFYYSRPSVWVSYRGGHSRYYHHAGFYTHRRPVWNGGLRGHGMHLPAVAHRGVGHHGGYRSGAGYHRPGGNGYHVDLGGHRGGMNPGSGRSHSGGHSSGVNPGSGRSHSGGHSSMGSHSGSRGNSFDGSSSRVSGSRISGGSRGGSSYGGSRGSSVSRGGGSHSGGGTRGGGSHNGGSRGGRR